MSLFTRSRPKGRSLSPPPSPAPRTQYVDDKERFKLSGAGMGYDVESGVSMPQARLLHRALARRSRLILTVAVCVTVILYYTSGGGSRQPPPPVVPFDLGGANTRLAAENIWDDLPPAIVGAPKGKAPAPPARPPRPDDPNYYLVDEYGDHFLVHKTRDVPPFHPGPRDMMKPEELFDDVDIATYLKAPKEGEQYPDSMLRDIISEPLPEDKPYHKADLPADSFAAKWKAPKDWKPPTPGVKKVQWPKFATKDGSWESKDQRDERIKRRDAVKRGFVYAWQAYKDVAWGHDEVRPRSGGISDPFSGWGASIVDTLDTLLLMGLEDEYNLCRPHVNQINFNWVRGHDWSQGYQAPTSEDGWTLPRSSTTGLPVFETGIRYLGGLLGAYDLSGDKLMLDRAVDIAEVLGRAFNTRSGLPQGSRIDPGAEAGYYTLHRVSVAEVGSMTLELIRLSQATGDRKWFDLAQRCMDFLDKKSADSVFAPLLPMSFSPDTDGQISGSFSFGAMTDSYFEYLIKAYKLLGGGELAKLYKRLYEKSIDTARKVLFTDIDVVPGRDLFTIGKHEGGKLKRETEHLACFAGGMLALGAKLLDRPQDLSDGARFTTSCYWLSASTTLGIQPENVFYFDSDNPNAFQNLTLDGNHWHAPIQQPWKDEYFDRNTMYKSSTTGDILWVDDHTPVKNDSGRVPGTPLAYYSSIKGKPPGTSATTAYYINRPETIESVFYMYRLTGDRAWQDKGWRMFGSWMNSSRSEFGISSINDINSEPGRIQYGDNMESFIFAETFKYHYLLQSDPDLMSLDDYVLNTEAHPLIANYERDMKAGSQGFWDPKLVADQNLGTRGEGTNTQKWDRYNYLKPTRERHSKDK